MPPLKRGRGTVEKKKELFELPPLSVHGANTSVDRMTQTELRTFIPIMMRYSTGRKPGWGNKNTVPTWWPKTVPWENVKSDTRSEEEKQRFPWTDALRQIVINCYEHHGRVDLLTTAQPQESKALPKKRKLQKAADGADEPTLPAKAKK